MPSDYKSYVIDKVKEAGKAYDKLEKNQFKDSTKTKADIKTEKKAFFETYRHVMGVYEYEGEKVGKANETKETGYSKLLPVFGKKEAKEFIAAYYNYINHPDVENENDQNDEDPIHSIMETVDRKSRYAQSGTANNQQNEAEENEERVDGLIVPAELTAAQKFFMNQISQWMVRNAAGSNAASSFVLTFIMNQPVRLKLLAYYLIETESRRETDSAGILESQRYVPDIDRFKDKMIASKFKFWKRFTGSEIYWDKLGDAMRTALSCKPIMIKMYGSEEMRKEEVVRFRQQDNGGQQEHENAEPQDMERREREFALIGNPGGENNEVLNNNLPNNVAGEENREENQEINGEENREANREENQEGNEEGNRETNVEENQEGNEEGNREANVEENQEGNEEGNREANREENSEGKPEGNVEDELRRLDVERSNKLSELLRAIQDYDREFEDQEEKQRKKQNVLTAFQELIGADGALETYIKQNDLQREGIPQAGGKSGATASEPGAWKKTGDYNTNAFQVVNAYSGISKALIQCKAWNLNDDGKLLKGKIDEVLGLATAPVKLINLFLSIKDLIKNSKDMTVAAKISKSLDIIYAVEGLGKTGITSFNNISKWVEGANFVANDAAKLSPAVSGTLGIVTGGTQLLASGVKLGTGLKKSYDISKTRESLEALNSQPPEEQNPDNQFDDTEYEMTGEALEVERRNNTTANSFALVNALAGAANTTAGVLTLTGVGAAAGAILGAIGSGTVLAASIAEYFANRRNRMKAIDIYMGIDSDETVNAIGDSIARGMRGHPDRNSVSELKTSNLREAIRNTVMHKKGYMSPESFYSKVCMDYAQVIHRGLFKRRGEILRNKPDGDAVYEYDQVKGDLSEKEKMYAKMLYNVKLKPRFSKNIDNCTPSPQTIATKLKP